MQRNIQEDWWKGKKLEEKLLANLNFVWFWFSPAKWFEELKVTLEDISQEETYKLSHSIETYMVR